MDIFAKQNVIDAFTICIHMKTLALSVKKKKDKSFKELSRAELFTFLGLGILLQTWQMVICRTLYFAFPHSYFVFHYHYPKSAIKVFFSPHSHFFLLL